MKDHYKISGEDTTDIINIIKPGDILLRGFNDFKKFFIFREYYDSSIYVGRTIIVKNIVNKIIYENLISFLRCDKVCILRLDELKIKNHKEVKEKAIDRCHQFVDISNEYELANEKNCNINFEVPIMSYQELGFFSRFKFTKFKYMYDDFSIVNSFLFNVIYKKG